MNKIIIDNRTSEPDDDVLLRVYAIISDGRVSETAGRAHYCHVTTWKDGMVIYAGINAKSDRFVVMKDETKPHGWDE